MGGEVRYCTTSDGVRIAYSVEGKGPALVVLQIFVESFSFTTVFDPEWTAFHQALQEGHTVVRFDARGTGLSQREVDDLSNDALVGDIEAVIAAAKLKRFTLFGETASVPRAIEYAARHPTRVTKLILIRGFTRLTDVMSRETVHSFAQLAIANWPLAAQAMADLRARRRPASAQAGVIGAELFTASASGQAVARLLESNADTDVTGLLPEIKSQTLILHEIHDEFVPLSVAQKIAAAIPNSRLVTIDEDFWPAAIDAVRAFMGSKRRTPLPASSRASTLRTVLFTDLVGHTEMMSRLGDDAGRAVLREHERITREVLKANGGTEVKTMGDGFMASFGSVTRAVECAIALQKAFAHHTDIAPEPLSVRVGLNAGEPIEEDGDLFGATVILASRIAAKALGGEILASDVVRGLCTGKGFLFSDRGEFVAKGFEDPVRVHEIGWQQ